ncbi:MAG: hypothetical protein CMK32_05045 [Porticoccaceae bacterium]|nr:hypothetical protein [Porticoccaceae bacterium]
MSTNSLTLYTGAGCHLCEDAKALIFSVLPPDWQLKEVNIGSRPELQAAYGQRIPVVVIGGQEKGWPFSAGQLKNMLASASA